MYNNIVQYTYNNISNIYIYSYIYITDYTVCVSIHASIYRWVNSTAHFPPGAQDRHGGSGRCGEDHGAVPLEAQRAGHDHSHHRRDRQDVAVMLV